MRKFYLQLILILLLTTDELGAQITFTCPNNETVYVCSASGGTVNYSDPVVVFNALGGGLINTQLNSGFASGSNFPVGPTAVTWQANFACDKIIQPICTLTCSFTVTVIQEQPVTFYEDADGDGHGASNALPIVVCHPTYTAGLSTDNTDCDDSDPTVWRVATIYVDHDGDGYDNGMVTMCYGNTWPSTPPFSANIFGKTVIPAPGYSLTTLGPDCNDEDKTTHSKVTYYRDADGDGYGDLNNPTTVCTSTPPSGYVTNNNDCNDNDGTLNPTTQWVLDADKDGYYVGDIITQCTSPGTDYVKMALILVTGIGSSGLVPNETPGDCDDHNPAVHATFSFYADNDGDGYGVGNLISGVCAVSATTPPAGYSLNNTDCDDNDLSVWHLTTIYTDRDHDGYDAGNRVVCTGIIDVAELSLAGYSLSTKGPDCDDNNAAINPATVWYKDTDNDGYSNGTTKTQCTRPTGYKLTSELTATSGDCNDNDPTINPATKWVLDADHDGYYSGGPVIQCVNPGTGYVILTNQLTGDCNDNDPTINPGAVEVCGNGIDDNCNGSIDEKVCYACQNGTNLTTTNITSSGAKFNWVSVPNSRQWQVEYKSTSPGSKWIDVILTGNLRSTTISGLKANSSYQWHIRALCGKSWTDYSIAITFKTLSTGTGVIQTTARAEQIQETPADLQVKAMPNPTNTNFTVTVKGNSQTDLIKMFVVDMYGRIIEERTLPNEQTITLGDKYRPGVYFVKFIQGEQSKQLKLIKMPQ